MVAGRQNIVALLLAHGADPNHIDAEGSSLVTRALLRERPNYGALEALFASDTVDLNLVDARKRTVAHYVAANGDARGINLLAKYGADLDIRDAVGGRPLHAAAYADSTAAIDALAAHGADVNAIDDFRRTPLHWAAQV